MASISVFVKPQPVTEELVQATLVLTPTEITKLAAVLRIVDYMGGLNGVYQLLYAQQQRFGLPVYAVVNRYTGNDIDIDQIKLQEKNVNDRS